MRAYIPMTVASLRAWHESGQSEPALEAWAVTSSLRDTFGDVGDEEVEYAVATAAAESAAELHREASHGRRVVVVADIPDRSARLDAESPGAVTIEAAVQMSLVAAVLADAAEVALEGSAGDPLGWFAVQEIPDLLA